MQIRAALAALICFLVAEPSPDRLRRATRRKAGQKKLPRVAEAAARQVAIVNLRVALVCCNSAKGW
jgi:hypothetical protein